jgi:hypothetical protein
MVSKILIRKATKLMLQQNIDQKATKLVVQQILIRKAGNLMMQQNIDQKRPDNFYISLALIQLMRLCSGRNICSATDQNFLAALHVGLDGDIKIQANTSGISVPCFVARNDLCRNILTGQNIHTPNSLRVPML